jgi:hypothetical protein
MKGADAVQTDGVFWRVVGVAGRHKPWGARINEERTHRVYHKQLPLPKLMPVRL